MSRVTSRVFRADTGAMVSDMVFVLKFDDNCCYLYVMNSWLSDEIIMSGSGSF